MKMQELLTEVKGHHFILIYFTPEKVMQIIGPLLHYPDVGAVNMQEYNLKGQSFEDSCIDAKAWLEGSFHPEKKGK